MDKLKIIVISATPWDDNNSFGNSFSNIFGNNPNYEIANIYCETGLPNTKVCTRYFQITIKGIIKSWFKGRHCSGNEVFISNDESKQADTLSINEAKFFSIIKRIRLQIFFWIRDLIWSSNSWKSNRLIQFILDFNPDLVFLPVYYSSYMNNVGLYTQKIAGVKMAGYISDDCYTLKQFSLSPLFWIDRLIKRRYVKKGIDACKILYVITPKQKEEYERIFGNKCKVLYKGGEFISKPKPKKDSGILTFAYTGNIYDGRWKTLELIGKAINVLNTGIVKAQFLIYTQNYVTPGIKRRLTIPGCLYFMGSVPSSLIKEILSKCDILVHVESFLLSERYKSRLSFSTKIVDYLESGKCLLAVGWGMSGGIEYLSENDAAYVITTQSEIKSKINELVSEPGLIELYGNKAFELGKKNHQISIIRDGLYQDLKNLSKLEKDK